MIRENDFWAALDIEGCDVYRSRGSTKFDTHLRVAEIGRNICFGKGGGSAPAADPQVGRAALMQAKTGEDWLTFAKEQFAESTVRQTAIDALSTRVTEQQIQSQDKANKWSAEDRDIAQAWGKENRDLAKNTFNDSLNKANSAREKGLEYEKSFNDRATKQYAFADEQQQRYKSTFQPVEDKLAKDAMSWDSDARQAEMAAQARSDVMNNAAIADQQRNRQMASMGVDPRSGRFDATGRANGLLTALSAAGAQNTARDTTRQQGIALRGQAAGIGQQVNSNAQQANAMGVQATGAAHQAALSGDAAAMQWNNLGLAARGVGSTSAGLASGSMGYDGLGLGVQAGSSALNSSIAASASANANTQVMAQGFQGAMNGYAGQASTLNNQYSNQISAQNTSNQAAQSKGQQNMAIVGTVGTIALAF